jgi:tetratricopeptide (TPR) repeat protein
MQALKKAERAKQNSLPEDEQDRPSEAFDEILALTPEPAPAPATTRAPAAASSGTASSARPSSAAVPARAAAPEFSLEPMDGLSLEPLAPPVAASTAAPRPSPSPLPAASDHKEPGLTMDLALDPVAAPPAATPATRTAPSPAASATASAPGAAPTTTTANPRPTSAAASPHATSAAASQHSTASSHSTPAAASMHSTSSAASPHSTSAAAAQPFAQAAAAAASTSGAPHSPAEPQYSAQASGGGRTGRSATAAAGGAAGADKPRAGAAARARTRAAATAEPTGIDPERMRLIGLIAILLLLVGGFGIYYWRALTAPGAGAGLPPVPMPPAGATGASGSTPGAGQVIFANGASSGDPSAAGTDPAAGDIDPLMAPSAGSSRGQQDLERRLAKTEQDLAAAQQAIQSAAPRTERMPVLAAPANSEIRVTRIVQPAPVSPTLDSAYQAFNSGDSASAQQQYDAAIAQDANNRDALLGAAHVAARQNQKDKAAAYYLRLLELSPNDADATAGLIGLRQGDISQSEARLKAILANNPEAASVQFTLGNLYAQQGRWPDAQQAYFRAVGAAPDNPDYAYNLAIGLDRLNQGKLALSYYQRALALAQDKAVGFDRNTLRKRMHELSIGTTAR